MCSLASWSYRLLPRHSLVQLRVEANNLYFGHQFILVVGGFDLILVKRHVEAEEGAGIASLIDADKVLAFGPFLFDFAVPGVDVGVKSKCVHGCLGTINSLQIR